MNPEAERTAQVAYALFARGQWAEAGDQFRDAIELEPGQGYLHWAMAMCHWAQGDVDRAGEYLQAAVRIDPSFAPAHAWLGQWYLLQGMIDVAMKETAKAMELAPNDVHSVEARAWVLEAGGEADSAWTLLGRLRAAGQLSASLARLYGRLAGRYGQDRQALSMISGMLQSGAQASEASLYFTAGDLLDRGGNFDEAFASVARGHALYPAGYDEAGQERLTGRLIEYFTGERIRSLAKATCRSDRPVFVVGMPRSGTSLMEQILASHPAVHGAGELDFMERVLWGTLGMVKANQFEYPGCLDRLTTDQADGMAQVYLGPLAALAPQAMRITDKMPLNFIQLGLIALLFPDARVIHCRRNPMDTCLSCYMTYFSNAQSFVHNLRHLGHFHRQYERLMAHWKRHLDLPILEVCYEETVADPEGQSRRMIEFLGLPWDERCLQFHQVRRAVATASVQQVRKPIYNTSVEKWRKYEKHLGPLKAALWRN